MSYFVDTHCHIGQKLYSDFDSGGEPVKDVGEVIRDARSARVTKIISVGADLLTSNQAIHTAKKYPEVHASVGVHPDSIVSKNQTLKASEVITKLSAYLKEPKLVAIGEIGLDYGEYTLSHGATKQIQLEFLDEMLTFVSTTSKPVIIHCRDAWADLQTLLKKASQNGLEKGVCHCFMGSYDDAKWIIDLGFKLGIGGILTFPNAGDLRGVVKKVGTNHVILETDAPWLAPQNHRGEVNYPEYIPLIAEVVARECGVSIEEVRDTTTSNAENLFGLESL